MDYDHALCSTTVRPWFNWNLWFLGIWFSESHCNVRRSWLALVSSLSLVISFVHNEKWSIYLWACFISSYLGLHRISYKPFYSPNGISLHTTEETDINFKNIFLLWYFENKFGKYIVLNYNQTMDSINLWPKSHSTTKNLLFSLGFFLLKNRQQCMSHRCSECNMHFGNAGALGSHQRVHKIVITRCSICGEIFRLLKLVLVMWRFIYMYHI